VLSYRSFFSTEEMSDFDRVVESQIHSWLRGKDLPDDHLEAGRNEVKPSTFVDVIDDVSPDESRRHRFRLTEPKGWVTEVTTESLPGQPSWVWLEIHSPDDAPWTATPGLLRKLVGSCEARDGLAVLRDQPLIIRQDAVDEFVNVVCDPDRRGPIFVAGSSGDRPWDRWRSTVDSLLAETVGLAGGYILDPSATVLFADRVGSSHAVPAGAVRTFLPEADPADELDARRHRILGPRRIASDEAWQLRRMLGRVARRYLIEQPLPARISRVDRVLQRSESDLLVSQLATSEGVLADAVAAPALGDQAAALEVTILPEPAVDERSGELAEAEGPPSVAAEAEAYLALSALIRDVLGSTTSVETASIAEVVRLARHGLAALTTQQDIRSRLHELQSKVESLEDERTVMRAQLDDALLDQAADVESGTYLQDKVRYLQRSLEKLGQGEMAWSEVPTEELTKPPSSFSELMERLDELRHVVLGDDRDPALELDEQDILGTCAAKAWTALLALDDYAEARLQGDFEQGGARIL